MQLFSIHTGLYYSRYHRNSLLFETFKRKPEEAKEIAMQLARLYQIVLAQYKIKSNFRSPKIFKRLPALSMRTTRELCILISILSESVFLIYFHNHFFSF